MSMKFAYVRDACTDREIDNKELFLTINKAEIAEHNVFVDSIDSNEGRQELLEMLESKDVLLIRSIVDLDSKSVENTVKILQYLQQKKVLLHSIEEDRLNGRYPYSNFKQLRNVAMYYAELKRKRAYNEALKAKRVGRPKKMENVDKAIRMYSTGKFTINEITDSCMISKSTFYRAIKDYKQELKDSIEANRKSIAAAQEMDEVESNWGS